MGKKQSTLYPTPVYYTDWRQKPSIPLGRGKHYNISKVGPPITTSVYPPTILFGRLLKLIWGKSPIWEISQSSIDIDDYLPILDGTKISIFGRIPHRTLKYPYRLLSKHLVLAKRSSNVRFAGEMRKVDNGETLLINNNSGTYRPDDKMVPDAVAYFQRLFPHLLVREISRH
ncbi:unnamed protein product [Adineta steineri]|uniref:Uncharacterized protein n=1 Tax=Adineta steineri TaxID=433720 RepID=A0A818UTK1_9BILA|nr:unnamed protein product [Adineta steineri]CAF3697424.1 unnamed protein product [Adineta steineri]